MIRIIINNIPFFVKKNISILEAVSFIGLKLPRFCYHEALSVAGNCRICLVEIEAALKLVASCAQPVSPDMQIFTNSIKVLKARENVLESLLLNHPLDCPICDQAGECDLQDQSKTFGSVLSRNFFSKRSVENKIIDPCIKTIMTRCIHCTRCVRFVSEISNTPFLGTLNRGRSTEIGSYISHFIDSSEISGNVIDLCPVGALTAKPYAFKARPWELRTVETIDLTDGLGSNIYANLKELELINVLPKNNDKINGQWISNKARFSYDAQHRFRVSSSYKKNDKNKLEVSNYINTLSSINTPSNAVIYVNDDIDLETAAYLKQLELRSSGKIQVLNTTFKKRIRSNYYENLNRPILNLQTTIGKLIVILASNIKSECAVINAKLRIKSKNKKLTVLEYGFNATSNFEILNLNIYSIVQLLEAKDPTTLKVLKSYQPVFILGEALFARLLVSSNTVVKLIHKYFPSSLVYVINQKSNTEALNMLNIKSASNNVNTKESIIYLNLEDSFDSRRTAYSMSSKNQIWINSHGSQLAKCMNYILPVTSYFENEAYFINLEGRPQQTSKVVENGQSFNFTPLELVKELFNVSNFNMHAYQFLIEIIKNPELFNKIKLSYSLDFASKNLLCGNFINYPFKLSITDYYLTNSYSKYSLNMVNYSQVRRNNFTNF